MNSPVALPNHRISFIESDTPGCRSEPTEHPSGDRNYAREERWLGTEHSRTQKQRPRTNTGE
jgi:hypothetical protein